MSSPVYELLKRPDELFVVEQRPPPSLASLRGLRRVALKETLDSYPELGDGDFVQSRQVNLETIHTHDVVAERYGTVGELRGELHRGERPARHTNLEEWRAS